MRYFSLLFLAVAMFIISGGAGITDNIIINNEITYISNAGVKWVGKYSFQEKSPGLGIFYELELFDNGLGTFSGNGYQTYFGVNVEWEEDGNEVNIYYQSKYEGNYIGNRKGVLATLSKKKGKYYLKWSGENSSSGVYKLKKES